MTDTSNSASAHQLISPKGVPSTCSLTKWVWVSNEGNHFAQPTCGNHVTPFTTGEAYYAALLSAFETAQEEILIAGWQVNWDALLAPGKRLFDALLAAARRKDTIKIIVMPWNDSAPVQTFDDQTRAVLLLINDIVGKEIVRVHLAASLADESRSFFSHHQKQVVVDRKIAFVGGMDLAYGRFDDEKFTLQADAQGRRALNCYNGCIAQVGKVDKQTVVDTDALTGIYDQHVKFVPSHRTNHEQVLQKILAGAWQVQYAEDSVPMEKATKSSLAPAYLTVAPSTQPRLPWQDIHCRIEGPAVSDLTRNFVLRWNAQSPGIKLRLPNLPKTYAVAGKCQVQVLRSASSGLRKAEAKSTAGVSPTGTAAQSDILQAMIELIRKADHFIYIENQFFCVPFRHKQCCGAGVIRAGKSS